MADEFSFEVKGLKELQAKLEELGTTEARTIVREGLKAGGAALQQAMVEGSTSVPGEPGQLLRSTTSWSKRVTMLKDALAGIVRVRPKGELSHTHTSKGHGMQPKGHRYHRSLAYLVKLAEFGGNDPAYNVGKSHPMTSGFESHQDGLLNAIIATIKERLKL